MKKLIFLLSICMIAISCENAFKPSQEQILKKEEIEKNYRKRQAEKAAKTTKTITIAVFYSNNYVDTLLFETTKSHIKIIENSGSSHVCCWNGWKLHKLQGSIFQTTAPVKVLSIK